MSFSEPTRWSLPGARRAVLLELLTETSVDASIWHLIFSRRDSVQCADYTGPTRPWALRWMRSAVSVELPSHLGEPLVVNRLATTRDVGRVFPVQQDAFLCATHSLNALARAIVLTPGSILDTIATFRPSVRPRATYELYPQREELVIAALREGVVLGSVLLNDFGHFAACDDRTTQLADRDRCLELAARTSGGLMLLFSSGGGVGGHFVTIVPIGQTAWGVYDTDRVVRVRSRFGEALTAACRERMLPTDSEVVGLVPLQKHVSREIDLWRRTTLRNMSTVSLAGGISVSVPIYTPIDIHAASACVNACAELMTPAELARVNLFTYFAARNRFETEMAEKAEEIAASLVTIVRNQQYVLHWEHDAPPALRASLTELPAMLAQLASLLRASIGVLFGAATMLPNRDWLRYIVVYHSSRCLQRRLARDGAAATADVYRLVAATAAIAVTWHRRAGESAEAVREKYRSLDALFRLAKRHGVAHVFGAIGVATRFERTARADMANEEYESYYMAKNRYERNLWLLHALNYAGVETLLPNDSLDCLVNPQRDTGDIDGDTNTHVAALRTAFVPIECVEAVRLEASVQSHVAALQQVTPADREAATIRQRRAVYRDRFASFHAGLAPDVRRLGEVFVASSLYCSDDELSHAEIDRQSDALPHLLEQAFVRTSATNMYGTTFDAYCEPVTRVDEATLSPRVCRVTAGSSPACFQLAGDAFAAFEPLEPARQERFDNDDRLKRKRMD